MKISDPETDEMIRRLRESDNGRRFLARYERLAERIKKELTLEDREAVLYAVKDQVACHLIDCGKERENHKRPRKPYTKRPSNVFPAMTGTRVQ